MGSRAERTSLGAPTGGPALERLILDTTILIAVERRLGTLDQVIDDGDDVALAAVTAAELLVGVELADRSRVKRRQAFVEQLLSGFPVLPYDLSVARVHGRLLAHCQRAGQARGGHDLLIAATASATHRTVVTADASGFGDLPDVTVRVLPTRA